MQLQIDKLGKVSITVEQNYWNINKDYDKLTVVEKEGIFGTFISRKPVPAGIVLTNREYWIPFSSLKEDIILDYNSFKDKYGIELVNIKNDISNIYSEINNITNNGNNNGGNTEGNVNVSNKHIKYLGIFNNLEDVLLKASSSEIINNKNVIIMPFNYNNNIGFILQWANDNRTASQLIFDSRNIYRRDIDHIDTENPTVSRTELTSIHKVNVNTTALNKTITFDDYNNNTIASCVLTEADDTNSGLLTSTLYQKLRDLPDYETITNQINEVKDMAIGFHITTNASVAPATIYKGENTNVNISYSASISGKPLTCTATLNSENGEAVSNPYSVSDNRTFNVYIHINNEDPNVNTIVSKTLSVKAYYPRYYGVLNSETITSNQITTLTKMTAAASAAASNVKTTVTESSYLWLCVPNGMTINKVTSSGFDVPMSSPINVEVTNKGTYKCYRSVNKINAGSITYNVQ